MKKENKFLYNFLKVIYTVLLKILYRPKIIGKENIPKDGALIFAGNHRRAFDPVIVMMCTNRYVHYMAKEEVYFGLHGKIFKALGVIKVHKNKSGNVKAVLEAEKILKNGGTIGIFPEGTRNRSNEELQRFKHGAVVMAQKTNTCIMPFAIKGKYAIFNKDLTLEFGKPIDVTNMQTEEANNYLKNEVLNLLRK